MARDATAPVAPFGATRAGVTALVPEARLVPGDGPLPVGKYGITEGQVDAWVDEVTGAVAIRLDGWERLSDTPTTYGSATYGGTPTVGESDRDTFTAYARSIVHNGAAAYLEGARFPERAEANTTSYAAVLWERYRTGLDALVGWLTTRLANLDPGDTPEGDVAGGIAYSFPEPLFGDGLRF